MCGRVRRYQKGSTNRRRLLSINPYYVEGLSVTHGNPCQHMWAYMQLDSVRVETILVATTYVLSFQEQPQETLLVSMNIDPSWDGAGCSASSTCCSNTDQPWFHHQLSNMTEDDIEVRICRDQNFNNEGILVDLLTS